MDGERVRFPRGLARQLVQATAPSEFTQVARNPERTVDLRRRADDLRARVRVTVRPRPRRRAALRHDRGLPQLREARLRLAVAPPLRRDGVRAGRPPRQQAPLRHGRGAPALLGQAVHGLRHPPAARTRHGRDGPHRLRRGLHGGERRRLQPLQRELATRVGRDDARRRSRIRRGEPGRDDDAVHPRRRDEPGRPWPARARRRSPSRSRAWPTCQLVRPGAPVVLGSFASSMSMQSGAPTFGTPEPGARPLRDGAARAPSRRPVPLRAARSRRRRFPTRRPRTSRRTRCSRRCSAA